MNWTYCRTCQARVTEHDWARHQREHELERLAMTVICQSCGEHVDQANWDEHRAAHLSGRLPSLSFDEVYRKGMGHEQQAKASASAQSSVATDGHEHDERDAPVLSTSGCVRVNGITLRSGKFLSDDQRDESGKAIVKILENLGMDRAETAQALVGLSIYLMKDKLRWLPSQAKSCCDAIIGGVYADGN